MPREPLRLRKKRLVRLVLRTLLQLAPALFRHLRQQPQQLHDLLLGWQRPQRQLIHPEGPLGSLRYAEYLLQGSETQFFQLFRLTKAQFWRLHAWLEQRGLADTQFQTGALKLLIFL